MRLQPWLASLLCATSSAQQIVSDSGSSTGPGNGVNTAESAPSRLSTDMAPLPTSTQPADTTSNRGKMQATHTAVSGDVTSAITPTPLPTSTNQADMAAPLSPTDPHQLPVQPQLTPALGVAGVLLMISGLVLGLVGIKHRPTQTFLSTSLLIALGIEILIVYLMQPPISHAIQGAYLIAGAVGGCALGALALIFKEVSEGFGCMLGGFCLAMWLLVLSPGGLITNKPGKIIMIGLLCATGFALYVSRFTRVYGIIACTSFAGAYAFILGVDCFSQAGLKEFWLYIWDINPDVFPLFTDSYPINRNMRVEIAAVIILAVFGILSQIKIWKIVKQQKAKREADRIAEQDVRNAEEAEVGRDVEAQVARDRGDWEVIYESKTPDMAKAISFTTSDPDSTDFPTRGTTEKRSSTDILSVDSHTEAGLVSKVPTDPRLLSEGRSSPPPPSLEFEECPPAHDESQSSIEMSAPSSGLDLTKRDSNVSNPNEEPLPPRASESQRLSMASLSAHDTMQDAQTPLDEDDDMASSIAATAAEGPDMDALSVRLSRPVSMYLAHPSGSSQLQMQEAMIDDEDEEALCLPAGSRTGSSPCIPTSPRESYFSGAMPSDGASDGADLKARLPTKMSRAASKYRMNEWAKEVSRAELIPLDEVGEHTTDAVQVERADAAMAARAEENNAAPAPPAPPPGLITTKHAPVRRPDAHVDRVDSTSKQRPPDLHLDHVDSESRRRQDSHVDDVDCTSKWWGRVGPGSSPVVPVYAHTAGSAEEGEKVEEAKRTISNPTFHAPPSLIPTATKHTITTLPQLLDQRPALSPTESPAQAEIAVPAKPLPRLSHVPVSKFSTWNLLDARQDRLDARLTTTSFMTAPLHPSPASGSSASETSRDDGSQRNPSSHTSMNDGVVPTAASVNEEDMTLAERKALVHHRSMLSMRHLAMPVRAAIGHSVSRGGDLQDAHHLAFPYPAPQRGVSNPIYDSHQPTQLSSYDAGKQAMKWSQWRTPVAQSGLDRGPTVSSDEQMDMLRAARMQSEAEKKAREEHRRAWQAQKDQHMRMGGMHDAHRAAIEKLQRQVKD